MRRPLSIRQKSLWANMLASTVALLAASAAFIVFDVHTYRQNLVRSLDAQARVVGENSISALQFADPEAAVRTLRGLAAEARVIGGAIQRPDGEVFAWYARPGESLPEVPRATAAEPYEFGRGHVRVARRLFFNDAHVATIYVWSDLVNLRTRLRQFLWIVSAVLAMSLLLAFAVTAWTQERISKPILDLAATARRISEEGSTSVRAPGSGPDEIGALIATFNRMLDQIEEGTRALTQRAEELARSNAELERFAYVASHDLQEPLRTVIAYTQLLDRRHGPRLDAEAREYMEFITTAALRMSQLVQDLLTYSRVGRFRELRPVESGEALARAVQDVDRAIRDSGARVHAGPLPVVLGDLQELTQLFQNLLSNAIKFAAGRAPEIRVAAVEEADVWHFSVADNGMGIDPQYLDQIFALFRRLESGPAAGTGVGLAICKKVVERHGGSIWAESEPGRGSVFHFTLRAVAVGAPAAVP